MWQAAGMAGPNTARGRARNLMITEIKHQALAQLASEGAAQLSLRAIARELGVVSSALYRYYGSRDELLTALIVDAYSDLAAAIEAADAGMARARFAKRWAARATATRAWGMKNPSRFQLIYGSAVPGYRAPRDTVAPAARVIVALLGPVGEAAEAGQLAATPAPRSRELRSQLAAVTEGLELTLESGQAARGVGAFAEIIGLISLEIGGHFVGGFEPAEALFAQRIEDLADQLGLVGVG